MDNFNYMYDKEEYDEWFWDTYGTDIYDDYDEWFRDVYGYELSERDVL